jgi:hypothetical protein
VSVAVLHPGPAEGVDWRSCCGRSR